MFENLKAMGAIAGLLKDQQRLRESAERVRGRLARARVEGEAGGGAVRAVVDGQLKVVGVTLSPALVSDLGEAGSRARAEALIAEAINAATERARVLIAEEVSREADELGLPREMLQGLRGLMP
jgi:DNA-binding protein YbaB